MKRHFLFFSFAFFCPFFICGQVSYSVSGIIRDSVTSEPLAGANVFVKDLSSGTTSGKDGKFEIVFTGYKQNANLQANLIGYKKKEFIVSAGYNNVIILLSKDIIEKKEVIITESKITPSILESPVTLLKIDATRIAQLPNENFYSGLATFKGVNVNNNSLFYKSVHLRGFSLTYDEGTLQLLDGMDNLPPGQGFNIGNLDGALDIDVDNIEIIPGAASALYGANAFNGVISVATKQPYRYEGLTVQLKNGVNFIDGKHHDPALFSDSQIRYAKAYKNRFAFKFTAGYATGTDWLMLDETDLDVDAAEGTRGPDNPGRDIANIYGDEAHQDLLIGANGSKVNVSRTGYNANVMLGPQTTVTKISPSLFYKTKNETEFSYVFHYTLFNSNFGFQAWNFRNFSVMYNKLEMKNKNYFIRIYNVKDYDGSSWAADALAYYLNNKWKPDSAWFADYTNAYNGNISGVEPNNHTAARNYADIGMPQPGSEMFNQVTDEIKDVYLSDGGARYADESWLSKIEGQYDFSNVFSFVHLVAGFDLGRRKLYSRGTEFMDYPPPQRIYGNSYSGVLQADKDLLNKRLHLLASARYDHFDIHKPTLTPRLSGMFKINEKNFLRASYQTATRVPDPFDEYQFWHWGQDFGVGGLPLANNIYHLHERAFDSYSVSAFNDSVNAYVKQFGQDSLQHAVDLYKPLLKPCGLEFIQPEHITSYELGYQSLVMNNKLHVDINFFYSIYKDRINYTGVVLPETGNPFLPDSLDAAASSIAGNKVSKFYLPFNSPVQDYIYGMEAGVEFNLYKDFVFAGNITWQKSEVNSEDENANNVRMMPLKSNVSISNPALFKNTGFSVNWRWTDAFGSWVDPQHPFITNHTPANSILDAQLTWVLPKMKTSVKFGMSNFLNHYYSDMPQSAYVGGIYYISFLYNTK